MHANPYLARVAFHRINSGSLDYLKDPIFFQFIDCPEGANIREEYSSIYDDYKDKKAVIMSSYDKAGLKKIYDRGGSWEETFSYFEFIAPVHIYEKEDLSGRKFIENGINTGIPRLTINIVFNYKDVIESNPELKSALDYFEWERRSWYIFRVQTERILLLTIFFLLLVSSMAMYVTLKITQGALNVDTRKLQP